MGKTTTLWTHLFSVALSTQVGMVHHGNISVTDVLNTNIRIIIANIRIIIGPRQALRNARQAPKNQLKYILTILRNDSP